MSFSHAVKEELARKFGKVRHCQLAELAAILSACECKDKHFLVVKTDKEIVAGKLYDLLVKCFDSHPEISVRKKRYTIAITDFKLVKRIKQAIKFEYYEEPVSGLLLQSSCCKRAFLRGMFMCSGSVSDPNKSYHLEFVSGNYKKTNQLLELLETFSIDAKIVKRKYSEVVYIKEGRQIVDLLNVMEAPVALMEYENVRIRREINGKINRQVNCDTANILKSVSAAQSQIHDINLISQTIGLESLPRELKETAKFRLENPEMPLKELGELMNPKVGKSGINHRLRKLKLIASQIKTEEELYDYKKNDN
ncbi:Cytoplasmic hypothetical protein DUF199, a subgroup [Lachnospiraceae bacterium TWA4]|nr:Cytoplasmic hypothetical protein DUF199, a subgroup [Lachnospiraceae bacterium TWA4]